MRPLRYLNGRTLSPLPAEARQAHVVGQVFKPSVFPLGGGQGKPEYWAFIRVVQTSCPFTKKLLGGLDPTQAVTDKVHIVVADVARCIVRKNCSFPCTHDEVRRAH